MVRQIISFRYSNKARCRQTFEINRLFRQKSNFKAGANRKLRRRICNRCIIPLLEFINNYGSITDEKEATTQTNQMNSHKTNNQQQNGSSVPPQQNSVYTHRYKNEQNQNNKRDLKTVETIKKEDPSEETLNLTTRWKKK